MASNFLVSQLSNSCDEMADEMSSGFGKVKNFNFLDTSNTPAAKKVPYECQGQWEGGFR